MIKKISIFLISLLLITSLPTFANEELDLLEKAMVEEATTPAQKEALRKYFRSMAVERRKMAVHMEEEAALARGGKGKAENERSKAIRKRAKIFSTSAEIYEKKAEDLND